MKHEDQNSYDVIMVGGGAAGFFTAINLAEECPGLRIAILERSGKVLSKVKISGGGRCNVAHAEYVPGEMVKNYPRGEKELRGPFHRFMTADVVEWFEKRGVPVKTEKDGRMFPVSDDSQTIIDCFLAQCARYGVKILKKEGVEDFYKEDGIWKIQTANGLFTSRYLVVSSGSSTKIWKTLERLGHGIVSPVPSLFTFNIKDDRIRDLPGLAVDATVHIVDEHGKKIRKSEGPLLITHWGMSGPVILRLSAWGARDLAEMKYKFSIRVNWLKDRKVEDVWQEMKSWRDRHGNSSVMKTSVFHLPKRLWQSHVLYCGIRAEANWADLSNKEGYRLAEALVEGHFAVEGKSTFKEEFVTAGGVELSEVNFKTFESRILPGLYLVGEVLDIDAITGGFNFQNAWTGGYLAARAIGAEQT